MNQNLPNTKKTKNPNIKKLKVLITIVNRSKALFYTDLLEQYDVNMQMTLYGNGTANSAEPIMNEVPVPTPLIL